MEAAALHQQLTERGFHLELQGTRGITVSPASELSMSDRRAIRDHKSGLLEVIRGVAPPVLLEPEGPSRSGPVDNQKIIRFSWNGEEVVANRYFPEDGCIFTNYFSLDTETDIVAAHRVPRLALAVASDGEKHLLIHPDDVGKFVAAHAGRRIVFQNVAFDFHVLFMHFVRRDETDAIDALYHLANHQQLHDTMLLDQLIRIGRGLPEQPRDLAVIAGEYCDLILDKNDPYRRRFGEIIGKDWADVDPGFFEYAVPDPIATARAHEKMRSEALDLLREYDHRCEAQSTFDIDPDATTKFGLLTESIQVGAAIAFSRISRLGLRTDQRKVKRTIRRYERRLRKAVSRVRRNWPDLFKTDKDGNLKMTPKGNAPSKSSKVLQQRLERAAREIEAETGKTIEIPRTKKGNQVSTALDEWSPYFESHRELRDWGKYERTAKLSQFLGNFGSRKLRPNYWVLKRTGRTSCSSPNMQQVPRQDEFREMIVASPGRLLLAVDYKFIELVSLAAICKCRFGKSRLAQIIDQGIDPHCYTAALFLGMEYEAFMSLKKTKPRKFKDWRQMAKPINFGVPGGMGANTLVEYAGNTYGVTLSLDKAEQFRERLVTEIYPELELYLADTSLVELASNLNASRQDVLAAFEMNPQAHGAIVGSIRKIVAGHPFRRDGTPYNNNYVNKVWDVLNQINQNPELSRALQDRIGSPSLAEQVFYASVPTLTGRIRGGVTYTAQRNTQFQGLAADGAKLAIADLVLSGYRVVAFIHDEVLLELPDQGGFVSREKVDEVIEIVRGRMEEVTYGVPVECEYTLSSCWSKRAELIEKGDRVIAWRPPKPRLPHV